MEIRKASIGVLCVLAALSVTDATLSKRDKKTKSKSSNKKVELPELSVLDRSLVVTSPKWKEITSNHQLYSTAHQNTKHFPGLSLGYVTPWNNHGYDTAKWFAAKFTHISPVWLQLRKKSGRKLAMEGTHNIDQGWVAEVRSSGKGVKILPRVLFEGWSVNDYMALFADEKMMQEVAEFISQSIDVEVVRNKSTETMSFPLTVMSLLTTFSWSTYGTLIHDIYVQFPNFMGLLLSLVQLSLFLLFGRTEKKRTISLESPA